MKFNQITSIAAIASLANAAVIYVTKTHELTQYATVIAGVETVQANAANTQAAASATTGEASLAEPSTWVFSTNVMGQDIVFTSVVSGVVADAVRTLYEEHVIVRAGNSESTKTIVVQANPTTLISSTVQQDGSASTTAAAETEVEAKANVATTSESVKAVETSLVVPTTTSSTSTPVATSTSTPAATSTSVAAIAETSQTAKAVETSSSSSSSSSSSDFGGVQDEDFSKNILDAHNTKRARHGVPNLVWDSSAYEYAQAYADKYDCSGNLKHSGGKYGENLGVGFKTGESVVNAWYNEAGEDGTDYDYGSATDYNHFTQLIWKSTTKLGCAYKDCSAENWGKYIVCSYDPAGNVMGTDSSTGKSYMAENVLPPV